MLCERTQRRRPGCKNPAIIALSAIGMSKMGAPEDLILRGVHGDQWQTAAGTLATALATAMSRINLANVAGLPSCRVSRPGHHQFGQRVPGGIW